MYFLRRTRKLDLEALHWGRTAGFHYPSEVAFLVALWHILPFLYLLESSIVK